MITAKPLGISETASDRVSAAAGIGMHAGRREPANVDIVFWRKVQYIPPFQQRFFKPKSVNRSGIICGQICNMLTVNYL